MKILIFCAGFFPAQKYGGPPVSVNNFCSLMKEDECFIVAHNHEKGEQQCLPGIELGWNIYDNARVLYLSDDEFNVKKFVEVINEINPDVVYFQSLFESFVLPGLVAAKKTGKKVLFAPRGELCAGAMKKKYKKIPYIIFLRLSGLMKTIHYQSTSDEETKAIKHYFHAVDSRIHYLTNIPSIPTSIVNHPQKKVGECKILFISRIVPKKNLSFALKCLKNVTGKISFDIYGAIEDEAYWNVCKNLIDQMPSNIMVNYCGAIAHEQVNKTFSQYDAFLFPTFSENYGHVIVESLLAKCIPIISDQTPWNNLDEANAGWAISLKSENEFVNAINTVSNMDELQIQNIRKNIDDYTKNKLRIDEIRFEYKNILNQIAKSKVQ